MRDIVLLLLAVGYPAIVIGQLSGRHYRDRADVLTNLAGCVLFLLLARALVDWNTRQPSFWLIGLVGLTIAVALSGRVWSDLPWLSSDRPTRRGVSTAVQLVVSAAFCAVLL